MPNWNALQNVNSPLMGPLAGRGIGSLANQYSGFPYTDLYGQGNNNMGYFRGTTDIFGNPLVPNQTATNLQTGMGNVPLMGPSGGVVGTSGGLPPSNLAQQIGQAGAAAGVRGLADLYGRQAGAPTLGSPAWRSTPLSGAPLGPAGMNPLAVPGLGERRFGPAPAITPATAATAPARPAVNLQRLSGWLGEARGRGGTDLALAMDTIRNNPQVLAALGVAPGESLNAARIAGILASRGIQPFMETNVPFASKGPKTAEQRGRPPKPTMAGAGSKPKAAIDRIERYRRALAG